MLGSSGCAGQPLCVTLSWPATVSLRLSVLAQWVAQEASVACQMNGAALQLYEPLVFLSQRQRFMQYFGFAKTLACQNSNLSVFGSHSSATLHYRETSSQQTIPRRFSAIIHMHKCLSLEQVRRFNVYLLKSASTDLFKTSHRECQLLQPACHRLLSHLIIPTLSVVTQSWLRASSGCAQLRPAQQLCQQQQTACTH